ncbi:hypothetical protein [Paenibacillus sp.]|uniref:hypothetical protein n=1 Tax=Paenibacillus sp. TaxID=58172 RepID=UPI0028110F13|nr:hypothetical protein [Paenibacillus sp.]
MFGWKRKKKAILAAALFALVFASLSFGDRQEAQAANHTVTVYPNTVVQSDFLGVGVNVIPAALMQASLAQGYTEAHWEMDRKRILAFKPKVARVWFQIDWMEKTKGVYDWESAEMKALYKYLDAFQAAGTEIEFNMGWKVGSSVHSWFNLPGLTTEQLYISAPKDLDAYAASTSAVLHELIVDRGYGNIKYLTFYNEPNGSWDFASPGYDEKAYYASMVQKASQRLAQDGLRHLVQIWAPEEVRAGSTGPDWTAYMKTNVDAHVDGYSFHVYGVPYADLGAEIDLRQNVVGADPVHLTEFGWASDDASGWDSGYANTVIRVANDGVKSALVWQMNGVWTHDPAGSVNGNYTMWDSLVLGLTPKKAYYSAGLLQRYIPAHSAVVAVNTGTPDLRAAAFKTSDGHYTILLESKAGTAKNVTFGFNGVHVGKTFRKFVYQDSVTRTGNALLPRATGSFSAGASFNDSSVDANYNVIVYTTLPPQTQVEVTPVEATVQSGQSVQLSATVIDSAVGGVSWSVVGSGNGTVSASGLYTAPSATSERYVAVKAANGSDPSAYGIALLKLTPGASGPAFANAGFETPPTSNSIIGPATHGWTFASRAGIQRNGSNLGVTDAPEGVQTAYLKTDGGVAGQFQQTIHFPAGTYRIGFQAAKRTSFGGTQTFDVYFDNTKIGSYAPTLGTFTSYATDAFTATAGSHTVKFVATTTAGDNTAVIDAVTIEPASPPPTFANAGFETPTTTNSVFGPATYGWTFNSRAGIQHNGSNLGVADAPEGVQTGYLKTDGGVSGEFYQSATFAAGTYRIAFQAAKRTSFGGTQSFDVYFDNTKVGSFAPTLGTFASHTTNSFAASAGSHTVKFVATTTTGDNTAVIDDVNIEVVP